LEGDGEQQKENLKKIIKVYNTACESWNDKYLMRIPWSSHGTLKQQKNNLEDRFSSMLYKQNNSICKNHGGSFHPQSGNDPRNEEGMTKK
jgi:hypothetical protein